MKKFIFILFILLLLNTSGFSQNIAVSFPDTSFYPGSTVQIPVRIDGLQSTDSLYSFQYKIGFNSALLEFKNYIAAGFPAENFAIKSRSVTADSFVLWAAHSEPISASGILMKLEFEVSSSFIYDDTVEITFDEFMYNESVNVQTVNGKVTAITSPEITISTTSLDFGEVFVDSSRTFSFIIINDGNEPLEVSNIISSNSVFTISDSTVSLEPGDSVDIFVTFTPNAEVNYSGTVSIFSNDSDEGTLTVYLNGSGTTIPEPEISLSSDSLNIGTVEVDSSETISFLINNIGTASLIVNDIISDNDKFTLSDNNAVIEPGYSKTVTVTFSPVSVGKDSAEISIASNDADEDTVAVKVYGEGIILYPEITVTPISMDFEDVEVGKSKTESFTIGNTGDADLIVSSISSDNSAFTVTEENAVISPGDTNIIAVTFTPVSAGADSANITITSNDTDEETIILTVKGKGVIYEPDISVSIDSINFGDVFPGDTVSNSFTVSNDGNGDLIVSSVTFLNSVFFVNQAAFTLSPEEFKEIEVDFIPQATGSYMEEITILSNDADEDTVKVIVYGECIPKPTYFNYTPYTGASYSIIVESIIFNSLSVGDEIGVFDGDLCVGGAVYSGSLPLGISAWKDNSQTPEIDGYITYHNMIFKYYDASEDSVFTAVGDYTIGNGRFENKSYSKLSLLVGNVESQMFLLKNKWNLVSSYIWPSELSVENIFRLVTDMLSIVQNDAGEFYVPDIYNSIENWEITEAYWVHMKGWQQLEIFGLSIPLSTEIPLNQGWNYVPNFYQVNVDIETAFSSILDKLVIVQNDDGRFYIPGIIDIIWNIIPGEGYIVYVSESCTLIYPEQPGKPVVSKPDNTAQYYTFSINTGGSYSIVINSADINETEIEEGDEIGVFDVTVSGDTICVGAAVFDGNFPIGLTAWTDDSQTDIQDGYVSENPMIFKILDISDMIEYHASANFSSGNGLFGEGIYGEISELNTTIPTSIEDTGPEIITSYEIMQNYPNPFNPETNIIYQIPGNANVKLIIYDLQGKEIRTLVNENQQKGRYNIKWNGTNDLGIKVSSGVYIYRIKTGKFIRSKKMVYLR